ncbi:MAG: hypothetical protein ABGX63_00780, partial [bacterium]
MQHGTQGRFQDTDAKCCLLVGDLFAGQVMGSVVGGEMRSPSVRERGGVDQGGGLASVLGGGDEGET